MTQYQFPHWIRRILLSWLSSVLVLYLLLPNALRNLCDLDGLEQLSPIYMILLTVGFFLLYSAVSHLTQTEKAERLGIAAVFMMIAAISLVPSFTLSYLAVCIFIFVLLLVYGIFGWNNTDKAAQTQPAYCRTRIILILSVLFVLFVSAWTVGRIYCFQSPTFDMGIFSQMFYFMKESGVPMTTVERDGLLSHFAVHVSPIYYLLLPFYILCPTPAALQVLQALVLVSAVIPLIKLARLHGLSGGYQTCIAAMLLLYPAYSGGTGYDFHENCFLAPLILWTPYGFDSQNSVLTVISALLTLTVKEDAAVYTAVIALYFIVKTLLKPKEKNRRTLITAMILLLLSIGWFLAVTTYLTKHGDGVMTYRYRNFMYGESTSLLTVIKAVILHPMKVLYECADAQKFPFIGMTLLPLLGMPLLTRRYERYILLIPYVLVNLMPDYVYQHDIFFQYTFGSAALLFYLTVINLADMQRNRMRIIAVAAAAAVSALCFGLIIIPKGISYPVRAIQYYDYYQNIRDTLHLIPDDASVTASTFYTTSLSKRKILYDAQYCSKAHVLETEYVVLSIPADGNDQNHAAAMKKKQEYTALVKLLEENGYIQYAYIDHVLVIYQKVCKNSNLSIK